VAKHTKVLLTSAQTFVFAVVLSSTITSGGGSQNGITEFNPNSTQINQTAKQENPIPDDPLIIALIIVLSPTGAVVMTWLIPEWTLKITQILIDTDESGN
jgi:hypothetical protein